MHIKKMCNLKVRVRDKTNEVFILNLNSLFLQFLHIPNQCKP